MPELKLDDNVTVEEITSVDVTLQRIYLERSRVKMIAQAATYTFFIYLFVGMVGIIKSFFTITQFFVLLLMSVVILLVSSHPYMKSLKDEDDFLRDITEKIKHKKQKINRHTLKAR